MLAIQRDPSWIVPLQQAHASAAAQQANADLLGIVDTLVAMAPARLKADHVFRDRVSKAACSAAA